MIRAAAEAGGGAPDRGETQAGSAAAAQHAASHRPLLLRCLPFPRGRGTAGRAGTELALLKRIGVPILLMSLSSLLALALAEVGLRLFRPVQYLKPPSPVSPEEARQSLYRPSSVPGLSYEMVPLRNGTFEGMQVRTNSLGMRGGEPAPPGPFLYRIAVLGDSFTFGFGVSEEETYPALLGKILNESPSGRQYHFEVLNLGVVGYTSRDEAAMMKARAVPLHPRLVVVGYVLNDPEIDPRQSLHKYFDSPVWWRNFHVLRLLHLGWNWVDVWRFGGGDYIRYLHAPDRDKWKSVVTAFADIRSAAGAEGARVVVAIFPLVPKEGWAGYRYRGIHLQVGEAARADGFEVVDLLPVFSRYPPEEVRLSSEDDHPSPLGHALAARAIADALEAAGILPAAGAATARAPAGGPRGAYLLATW